MNNSEIAVDELFSKVWVTAEPSTNTSKSIMIRFKKIHPLAKLPTKAHKGDACYDIYGIEDVILKPHEIKLFRTGLIPGIPYDMEMQIRPRSGLAIKHGIGIQNSPGTIDAPYRSELGIIIRNDLDTPYEFKVHDRIAQAAFAKVENTELVEVDDLDETDRDGGFGSTGK